MSEEERAEVVAPFLTPVSYNGKPGGTRMTTVVAPFLTPVSYNVMKLLLLPV